VAGERAGQWNAGGPMSEPGVAARRLAIEALVRIERDDAYANLALRPLLDRSGLEERDRHLVTELVYGVTRMRRALDLRVDRYLSSDPPAVARAALRIGAYQLAEMGMAPHAAVSPVVSAVPQRLRGLVNAVLRRVATGPEPDWPDDATRRSYPGWIHDRLVADLGAQDAGDAMDAMNTAHGATVREDGYTQDSASQWVAAFVGAGPGDVVADVCAAPGGKATALAAAGASVIAGDLRPSRVRLTASNVARTGQKLLVIGADATAPPLRPGAFDRVLVDAPCSGLGVLHRRADARWRLGPEAVDRLAELQLRILRAAVGLVRPGGTLIYSVCTLTRAETLGVAESLVAEAGTRLTAVAPPGPPWIDWGMGGLLLPQAEGTDGMAVFGWQVAQIASAE